jgi:S-adenosylmethionine synthetase
MSTEPLKEYFECLRMFTSGVVECVDSESGMDLVKVKQLIEQDCLNATDASTMVAYAFLNVSITPRGAVVLAEWSNLLSRNTVKGQLLDALGKIIWLLAGMVITVFGSLLLKVLE